MENDDKARWVGAVIRRHEAALLRYTTAITGDLESARDVVQEALIQLCRANREAIESRVAAWLFSVCRNRALDLRKKERPMRQPGDDALATAYSPELSPAARAELRESLLRVLEVVESLPAPQREVVQLKFQQGLSYREISEVTGHSVSYVGNLLHHAVRSLKERLSSSAEPARARSAR